MSDLVPGSTIDRLRKGIVYFYMVLMSVQLIGIEGMAISPLKAVAMSCSFVILLLLVSSSREDLSVIVYAGIYWGALICCSFLSSNVVVWDRIFYRAMFLSTFICFYLILNSGDISISFFRRLLVFIIGAYGCVFILQNLCFLVGIRQLLLINLSGATTMGGGLKANGLAIEPSHAGRILAFVYWGVLSLTETMRGREMSFLEHFRENPYTTIFFWMNMLLMGSSTAMLGAAIVGTHFFKKHIEAYLLAVIAVIIFLNVDFHIEALDRLKRVIDAFLSEDTVSTLQKTESSGGSRIAPIVNSFTKLDLFAWETWVGQGSDNIRIHSAMFTTQRIGDINDFGLFSYIFSLVFVFKFCIRRFLCLETLLFSILLGFAIGSLYTCWSGMMVCTAIKYFKENYDY